jgi:lysophospholipase L1-like esterase
MAALGDSITRGFDACELFSDCPNVSWSTGAQAGLASQYELLSGRQPGLSGRAYNDARTGARAVDLEGQARQAVRQQVDYVTIMVGANDVCQPTEADMTPVATFAAQVDRALAVIASGLPHAHVFVASIPNLFHLWQAGHQDTSASFIWSLGLVCKTMLGDPTALDPAATARRARVLDREVDDNAVLRSACQRHPDCRFDEGAVFNAPISLDQLSRWDFFHPNAKGQAALAAITLAHGWWPAPRISARG